MLKTFLSCCVMASSCSFSLEIQNCVINHLEILKHGLPQHSIQAEKDLFQGKSNSKYTFFKPREKYIMLSRYNDTMAAFAIILFMTALPSLESNSTQPMT